MKPNGRERFPMPTDAWMHSAIIDIGSNTVRFVAFGGSRRAPRVLYNEKVTARLAREIADTGRMPDDAMAIALAALERFAILLTDLQITDVTVVATAAARDAENGAEFLDRVRALGLDPQLLSGEEEARASAMGVIGAFPGARGTVADLGGGSLELAAVQPGERGSEYGQAISMKLGTLRLPAVRKRGEAEFRRKILKNLKEQGWNSPAPGALYLVGGTWRALMRYAQHREGLDRIDPHGFTIARDQAEAIAAELLEAKPAKLSAVRGISGTRAAALPDAAALLQILLDEIAPERVVLSSWGLREGLMFERLDPAARSQDPLLAGITSFAATNGGDPVLASMVAAWTLGAAGGSRPGDERLRLAATILALAQQRSEPNLRAAQALDWALRKRWVACGVQDRAMFAAALWANCGKSGVPEAITGLAPPDRLAEATGWGLAIRLCRRLGGASRKSLKHSTLNVRGGQLVLTLTQKRAALRSESVESDLGDLARHLSLDPAIDIVAEQADLPRHVSRD